ncbi:tetratricopeptide repeat protein [Calothrix sp. FACHB-1219]|uniref:tetratricopeptide repeat protein n=1 Tax=unclassified Calothrix TaxID=2619626 RepID=UPI0016822041|nr:MULTISPECIES: tetratricopeptide repeat protein [unclassified Calothrix]MBD2203596.1 tetratricopeptide repeat protein [Calothrix sp. FACHB-168]MBD2219902.1 tetratricopeptide repeat protein [Calothrix sp. FACHB-1219]
MDNRESLERTLNRARRALQIIEEEKAAYGLRVPPDLQIELEDKQKEVASLEARLNQLQGKRTVTVPDNLPRYTDVFIGRKAEIARCMEALSPEERGWGVAIDGIGGMGKTALALEVAHLARKQALFDAYLFVSAKTTWLTTEGVRLETLALSSLDSFCREFAKGLGQTDIVNITDSIERRRALLDALRGRRVLLIWDNLETLNTEERDMIAEFLRKLPTPNKAIITSRRRTGESALTIRLDRLLKEEALELMREKGRLYPRLAQELNATKPEILTALYEAAGGNPLALDWTLGQVAHKGYSIGFALERLRNAANSTDLYGFLFADAAETLSKNDCTVLSALAVFRTPATKAALADATDLAPNEIQVAVEQLVTLSLVNDLDGERFGLHPLTRTYIRAAISGTDTIGTQPLGKILFDSAAQRKVLRYWVDYAQKYGGEGNDAYKTYDKLEAEWQNLESVATTLREIAGIPGTLKDRQAAQMLIDLEDALSNFLWFRGYWDEGVRLSEWRYQAGKALSQWSDAGWGAYNVAWIYYSRAETERAASWAAQMAEAMERGGSRRDQATAIQFQGLIAQQRQNWAEAERLYQEALAIDRELGEEADEAIDLNHLGGVARSQGQYDRAESYYKQALAIAAKLGEKEKQAAYWGNLGNLALDRNQPTAARPWYERQLALAQEVGRQDQVARAKAGLARVLEEEGRYTEALPLAQAALEINERLRDQDLDFSRQLVERLQRKAGE